MNDIEKKIKKKLFKMVKLVKKEEEKIKRPKSKKLF